MTTAKDVAAQLGLAVSTVGRALSDDPRISMETKSRVAAAAAELGYTPSRAARMMRGASSEAIGLIVPDVRVGLFAAIAHALSTALDESGYQLILVETGDDPARELRQVRALAESRVAGTVLVPTGAPLAETVRLLADAPHVQLFRRQPELGGQQFGIDDHQVLARATSHLTGLGHRRIAYVGGTAAVPAAAARLAGFRTALEEAGLPADAGSEYLGPLSAAEHGADAVQRMLVAGRPPTAVVSGSVPATQGILDELLAQGVRVPEDMSVVGFGDEAGWSWWGPGLTTTVLPTQRMASTAALWLLRHLTTPDTPDVSGVSAEEPSTRVWPCTLVVRGSAAPAAPAPAAPAPTDPAPFSDPSSISPRSSS